MQIIERICLKDWHIEAQNGDRMACLRGHTYTTSLPTNNEVTVFGKFWVRAPESIFEPLTEDLISKSRR